MKQAIGNVVKKAICWNRIRSLLLIRQHKRISQLCRGLLSEPEIYRNIVDLKPKKTFESDHIIWQYWGQGYDSEQLPDVVKICLDSVDKYAGDAIVVRVSDKNIGDYITLPGWLEAKKEKFPKANYSDLVRCMLLRVYGGCWLDATVLLSDEIPTRYWEADLFVYCRDDLEINKAYWENTFAAYFGWGKGFKVRMLNSIIFCKRNNQYISEVVDILSYIWKNAEDYPHYFFFQILTEVMIEDGYLRNFHTANDCLPHYLQQFINDPKFNLASCDEILKMTPIHKLTYKFPEVAVKLRQLI
ncbi:MAG: capsular biosynthesis protein [Bacteroides sp.]|nr:capsular biosynthesis protein [Bacteroides sp.]